MARTLALGLALTAAAMLSAIFASPQLMPNANEGDSDDVPPREVRTILVSSERAERELLKVLAHNLANAATPDFKSRYAVSEAVALDEGGGTRLCAVRTDFRQGELIDADRDLDLAIFGNGFFQVALEDGTTAYTRRGDFGINAFGNIVLRRGRQELMMIPPMTIPPDALSIRVDGEGVFSVHQPGQCDDSQVGQMQLAMFINAEGLKEIGGGLFVETDASGTATLGNPSWQGMGEIRQGYLEASNVDVERTLEDVRSSLARLHRMQKLLSP